MPFGESKNIEYKVTIPKQSERYVKTIIAFANTQGGRLIIGIDDQTHEVVGVDQDTLFRDMDRIANAVSDMCEPQIVPDIEPKTIDGICVQKEKKPEHLFGLRVQPGRLLKKRSKNLKPSRRILVTLVVS